MSINKASLYQNLEYNPDKPVIKVLFETAFTKEIRIAMKKATKMKEHQSSFPIVVQIVEGAVEFGIKGTTYTLHKGHMISLEGGIPHDVLALEDSIVRLTLTKWDTSSRVHRVVD